VEVYIAVSISCADETFYHPVWNGLRLSVMRKQAVDAECSVDAAPTISLSVNNNEEVPREKGNRYCLYLSCVPSVFPISRKKGAEALVCELPRRLWLTLRECAGNIPSLSF
jgi:hypothetical protein